MAVSVATSFSPDDDDDEALLPQYSSLPSGIGEDEVRFLIGESGSEKNAYIHMYLNCIDCVSKNLISN